MLGSSVLVIFFRKQKQKKNVSIRHCFQNADSEKSCSDVNAREPLREESFHLSSTTTSKPSQRCNFMPSSLDCWVILKRSRPCRGLRRMMMMMMHVVKCCKRASAPQALLPITHVEIQSYIVNADPNERCIVSSIWSSAWPCSEDK